MNRCWEFLRNKENEVRPDRLNKPKSTDSTNGIVKVCGHHA